MPHRVVELASLDGETLSPEVAAARRKTKRAAAKAAKAAKRQQKQDELASDLQDAQHSYDALFDAAQAQLQAEMAAAGMDGMLPLSFGGSRPVGRPRAKKRELAHAVDAVIAPAAASAAADAGDDTEGVQATKLVEKVHVTYDSDGQVSARRVEHIEVESEPPRERGGAEELARDTGDSAPPVAREVRKFWMRRDELFYKFGDGIELDTESWYSVTPQAIAEHIAARCRGCDVVVDPFAGCGGNVIQLAATCRAVIAIDIDPEKIRMARHNAAIYGVAHRIEFVVGDSIALLPSLCGVDAVFLSPPWGGIKYNRKCFDMDAMVVNGVTGSELFALARRVSKNVVYYLPKTTPVEDLEALAPDEVVDCETVVLNTKTSVMTAYYGDLAGSGDGGGGGRKE